MKKYRVEYFGADFVDGEEVSVPLGYREFIKDEFYGLSLEAIAFRKATPKQLDKTKKLKFWEL